MNKIPQALTSLEVAELMGRTHKKVLESIRLYISQMEEIEKNNTTSTEKGWLKYFSDSIYIAGNGQEQPCYNVTKIGCEFLAHKLKGIKGTEFTMRYIDRFHDMEEAISTPLTLQQQIQTIAKGTDELYQRVDTLEERFIKFEDELPVTGADMENIQSAVRKKGVEVLGGKDSNAYHDNSTRAYVYADIQCELRRQFGVRKYKEIKHKETPDALRIINGYKLPIALKTQVDMMNAQQSLNLE